MLKAFLTKRDFNFVQIKGQGGLFVCLFVVDSRIFHTYEDVTITGEGLQILTYILRTYDHSAVRDL